MEGNSQEAGDIQGADSSETVMLQLDETSHMVLQQGLFNAHLSI